MSSCNAFPLRSGSLVEMVEVGPPRHETVTLPREIATRFFRFPGGGKSLREKRVGRIREKVTGSVKERERRVMGHSVDNAVLYHLPSLSPSHLGWKPRGNC